MDKTIGIYSGLKSVPEAAAIRKAVFLDEQGFSAEFDDIDDTAVHALLTAASEPAATGRLYKDSEGKFHIGRIAVMKKFRSLGFGRDIVYALENEAVRQGAACVQLSAQVRARGFYERLGYTAQGEEYLDEFCPHITMTKGLDLTQ